MSRVVAAGCLAASEQNVLFQKFQKFYELEGLKGMLLESKFATTIYNVDYHDRIKGPKLEEDAADLKQRQ